MKTYAKQRRSQGPDFDGLDSYSVILSILTEFAPNGLPNYTCLKAAIRLIDRTYKLRAAEESAESFATDVTSALRLMMAHLFETKCNRLTDHPVAKIRDLINTIRPDAEPAQSKIESEDEPPSKTEPRSKIESEDQPKSPLTSDLPDEFPARTSNLPDGFPDLSNLSDGSDDEHAMATWPGFVFSFVFVVYNWGHKHARS